MLTPAAHSRPRPSQVLSANVFSVVWNIYLSFTTHRSVESEPPPAKGKGKGKGKGKK